MNDIFCPSCRLLQPTSHTYCARCGTALPTDLLDTRAKVGRFFAGVKVADSDPEHGFLRVSHYRATEVLRGGVDPVEVPSEHVRFSVWVDDAARCVISLPISEARELVKFLESELHASREEMTTKRV